MKTNVPAATTPRITDSPPPWPAPKPMAARNPRARGSHLLSAT
jgi:hypothetical protein